MSKQNWRLIMAASPLLLGVVLLASERSWLRVQSTAQADDALAEKDGEIDDATKRKPSLDDVLVSRIDFSLKRASAYDGFRQLTVAVRESLADVPEEFAIVLVGNDLMMEGITKNQIVRNIDAKQATVAELLTQIAQGMNPLRRVRDPSERDQKVVWTIGPNPRDPDKKPKVILITTRSAAKRKGFRLPAAFLPEAEQMKGLIIRGKPIGDDRKGQQKPGFLKTPGFSTGKPFAAARPNPGVE